MRKGFIIIAIIACSIPASFSARINGYFITNDGDTVRTIFLVPVRLLSNVPTYEKLQWKISYSDQDNQTHNLMPDQASEFCFTYHGIHVRFLSRKNTIKASNSGFNPAPKIFLRLILDGTLKLFRFYEYSGYTESTPSSPDPVMKESPGWEEVNILQKNNEDLFRPGTGFFRKELREYFSDYPDLAEKINNRTYKPEDLERVVKEYNETYMP